MAGPLSSYLAPLVLAVATALMLARWFLDPGARAAWAALLLLGGLAAACLLAPASRQDDRERRRDGDAIRKAVAFAALMLCVA